MLRNLFFGKQIDSPLLSEADLVEEMDLSLKRKYESEIQELTEKLNALEEEMKGKSLGLYHKFSMTYRARTK